MSRKTNPRRKPATQADVKRAKDKATSDACRACMAIFFTVLLDKERADKETLQRVWGEVESLERQRRKRLRVYLRPDAGAARGIRNPDIETMGGDHK